MRVHQAIFGEPRRCRTILESAENEFGRSEQRLGGVVPSQWVVRSLFVEPVEVRIIYLHRYRLAPTRSL